MKQAQNNNSLLNGDVLFTFLDDNLMIVEEIVYAAPTQDAQHPAQRQAA